MLKLFVAALLLVSHFSAQADGRKNMMNRGAAAVKAGKFSQAFDDWFVGAWQGDGEQQESIAQLLLGPHRKALKRSQRERGLGIRFLYRAAVGGRPSAMRTLSDAIRRGAFGAIRRPDAAECWSQVANGKRDIPSCVALTEFRDKRSRATCSDLVEFDGPKNPTERDAARLARLCLANKTPALLVPGGVPGERTLRRIREYEKHGIELIVTGDVFIDSFEKFRDAFNSAIEVAIDAREGHGYLHRLDREIDETTKQRRP